MCHTKQYILFNGIGTDSRFILVERDKNGMLHAVERSYDRVKKYLGNECDLKEMEVEQAEFVETAMDHMDLIMSEADGVGDEGFDDVELGLSRMFRITEDAYVALFEA